MNTKGSRPAPSGYRAIDQEPDEAVGVLFEDKLRKITSGTQARVFINLDENDPFTFLIEGLDSDDRIEVRFEEAHPEISESLRLRISNWSRRILGRIIGDWKVKAW